VIVQKIIYKFSEILSKFIGIPVSKILLLINLIFRFFFLGFENVNNFISTLPKSNIIFVLRLFGAKIGKNCKIESGLRFHNCKQGYENFIVGDNCHIGKDCFFDLRDKIKIENNVVISMQCTLLTHIDMNQSSNKKQFPVTNLPIIIKSNSYIGARSILLMGVVLGKNSFVGASSLVNKSILDFNIVVGVPIKKIGLIDKNSI
jgi:acetyltransferase-like isoleucine patch superfamily enzyme